MKRQLLLILSLLTILSGCAMRSAKANMEPQQALDALMDSIEWNENLNGTKNVSFNLPEDYPAEKWSIHAYGVSEYDDEGIPLDLYANQTWSAGGSYAIDLNGLTELKLQAWVPDENGNMLSRSVDLLSGAELSGVNGAETTAAESNCAYWEADLDGDGMMERIVLDVDRLEGNAMTVPWIESLDGVKLCDLDPIGMPYASSNTYALAELDGKTYLVEYQALITASKARYTCCLWTLSAKSGNLTLESMKHEDFPTDKPLTGTQREAATDFMNVANDLWHRSRLLFTTDQEVLAHLFNAETEETIAVDGPLYVADEGANVRYRETMSAIFG